jgi:hypothetical protein
MIDGDVELQAKDSNFKITINKKSDGNKDGQNQEPKIEIKNRTDGKGEKPKIKILDKPLGSNGEQREVVMEQDFNGRSIRFHKQLNSFDCGPCLVLNALEVMKGGDDNLKTIEAVREKIDSFAVNVNYGTSSWIRDFDIYQLFERTEGIMPIGDDFVGLVKLNETFQNIINTSIQNRQRLFVFSGSRDNHFVGHFLDENANAWRLNSFEDGPVQIPIDQFRNYQRDLRQENPIANIYAFQAEKS